MRNIHVGSSGYGIRSALVILLAVVLLDVSPAAAKLAASDTPIWPPDAKVGDLITAGVLIVNQSTPPNDTEALQLASLHVTPACASGTSPVCLNPNPDPGIFKVLSAVGDAGTCAGVV